MQRDGSFPGVVNGYAETVGSGQGYSSSVGSDSDDEDLVNSNGHSSGSGSGDMPGSDDDDDVDRPMTPDNTGQTPLLLLFCTLSVVVSQQ